MELRKICDDTSDMGMWELAHNMMFVKDGEAWYRDFEREIPLRELIREILTKHAGEVYDRDYDPESFDDAMSENLQYGTGEIEGVIALFYQTAWGAAELREWLKAYETHALPTTMRPEVLQQAIDTYGSRAQEEMAIEEMSELTKAIVKRHRAKDAASYNKAMSNIAEEMADVIIMLTQLLMFYRNRKDVQRAVDEKVKRLAGRLESERAEMTGEAMDAAAEALQPAT
jgi:NTP pyrophosphatase (non-canonical NTP hydrolase)